MSNQTQADGGGGGGALSTIQKAREPVIMQNSA